MDQVEAETVKVRYRAESSFPPLLHKLAICLTMQCKPPMTPVLIIHAKHLGTKEQ